MGGVARNRLRERAAWAAALCIVFQAIAGAYFCGQENFGRGRHSTSGPGPEGFGIICAVAQPVAAAPGNLHPPGSGGRGHDQLKCLICAASSALALLAVAGEVHFAPLPHAAVVSPWKGPTPEAAFGLLPARGPPSLA
jgi:hypothetical protein